jgi:hypothetical protein
MHIFTVSTCLKGPVRQFKYKFEFEVFQFCIYELKTNFINIIIFYLVKTTVAKFMRLGDEMWIHFWLLVGHGVWTHGDTLCLQKLGEGPLK